MSCGGSHPPVRSDRPPTTPAGTADRGEALSGGGHGSRLRGQPVSPPPPRLAALGSSRGRRSLRSAGGVDGGEHGGEALAGGGRRGSPGGGRRRPRDSGAGSSGTRGLAGNRGRGPARSFGGGGHRRRPRHLPTGRGAAVSGVESEEIARERGRAVRDPAGCGEPDADGPHRAALAEDGGAGVPGGQPGRGRRGRDRPLGSGWRPELTSRGASSTDVMLAGN